jgi:hypothetical protein
VQASSNGHGAAEIWFSLISLVPLTQAVSAFGLGGSGQSSIGKKADNKVIEAPAVMDRDQGPANAEGVDR